jgi:hypothetical protein
MNRQDRKDLIESVLAITDEIRAGKPDVLARDIAKHIARLFDLSRVLHALNEKQCSDPTWGAGDESKQEKVTEEVQAIGKTLGLTIATGGDPRGYSIKVKMFNTRRSNSFGGDNEWGIYAER